MNKRYLIVMIILGLSLNGCTSNRELENEQKKDDHVEENKEKEENGENTLSPTEIKETYIKGILIVNKKYPLPEDFDPQEDPVAKQALLSLINDAKSEGYDISDYYSGYRNFAYQKELYENYKATYGQAEADTFSARPGHSEHQTGLTFDLFHSDGAFLEREPEATWVSENAHKYGFIVRYQAGKESITGYQAEPWHLRFIGNEAEQIYSSNQTLEEYLGVEGGDYR